MHTHDDHGPVVLETDLAGIAALLYDRSNEHAYLQSSVVVNLEGAT